MASASDPAPAPLRRDAERNRRRLLAAAAEVFAERGLEVTLDDIAREAGVGVATAYRRFANKEELIDALFEERIGELVATAQDALTDEDPWRGLVGFLERSLERQATDRGLQQILFDAHHGRERVGRARARLAPPIGELVRRAQEAGELRPDLVATDVPLISMMVGTVVDFTRGVSPAAWRRHLELVLDGLRVRRDAPTPLPEPGLVDDEFERAMRGGRRGVARPPASRP